MDSPNLIDFLIFILELRRYSLFKSFLENDLHNVPY